MRDKDDAYEQRDAPSFKHSHSSTSFLSNSTVTETWTEVRPRAAAPRNLLRLRQPGPALPVRRPEGLHSRAVLLSSSILR